LKPNKVASLLEVGPIPLLVPLPEALALHMKKSIIMLVKLLKSILKTSNGGLSYFVSLFASLPLPLPLPVPLALALHNNKVKAC
jgi:hypothetical protein